MEPTCALETDRSLSTLDRRQRRLPGPIGSDDGDEQPGGTAEPPYHPGGTRTAPAAPVAAVLGDELRSGADLAQRRHGVGSISERSCQCVPQPSNAARSKVDAPAGSAWNSAGVDEYLPAPGCPCELAWPRGRRRLRPARACSDRPPLCSARAPAGSRLRSARFRTGRRRCRAGGSGGRDRPSRSRSSGTRARRSRSAAVADPARPPARSCRRRRGSRARRPRRCRSRATARVRRRAGTRD